MLMVSPQRLERKDDFQQFGFDGAPLDFSTPRVWAALIARPSMEQKAADRLREFRLFAYWPCYLKQANAGGGRRRAIYSPVIPGYIFVAAQAGSPSDPWYVQRLIPGIIGYLRDASGGPGFLTDHDIEIIRNIEGGLNLPPPEATVHSFKVNEKVRFIDDIYSSWSTGKIKSLASENRIVVETKLLGRIVPVTVYPHQIEKM